MSKVNYLIVAAGLFICGVMVFLMVKGVHLRERQMIKWSQVDSSVQAAGAVATFLFPILSEYDWVIIDNNSEFGIVFFTAFAETATHIHAKAKVVSFAELVPESQPLRSFDMRILKLDETILKDLCQKNDRLGCIGLKALKQFNKKPRDKNKTWINLYRLNENHSVLYYSEAERT